ncbi:hypothetical protein ACFL20_10305 [Spirochaetota bacterium]
MEAKAIVMALIGFFLLYGGFTCCVGIAWYHGRNQKRKMENNKEISEYDNN